MTERRNLPDSTYIDASEAAGETDRHPLLAEDPLELSTRPVVDDWDLRQRIRHRLSVVGKYYAIEWPSSGRIDLDMILH